jgi:hypothetical protein
MSQKPLVAGTRFMNLEGNGNDDDHDDHGDEETICDGMW